MTPLFTHLVSPLSQSYAGRITGPKLLLMIPVGKVTLKKGGKRKDMWKPN